MVTMEDNHHIGINGSLSSEQESTPYHNSVLVLIVKAISIVLISGLTCVLNYLVAYTLHKKSNQLQSPGNTFVLSLAISNFAFGVIVLPFNFVSCIFGEWIFGIMMCNLTGFVTMTVFTGSMVSIVVITIDRYYAILQPLLYTHKITSRRTKELIIFIWLTSLLGSLPPLFGWSRYTWLETTSNCLVQWDIDPSFAYTFATVFLLVPLCIVCYCYYKILRVARLTSRRTSNGNIASSTECNPAQRRRSRRTSLLVNIRMNSPTKAIRTISVTIGTLLLTIGPLTAVLIYQAIFGVDSAPPLVLIPATWLFFCSFVTNSCVYAVWNRSIRRELMGYICVRGRCMDDDDVDTPPLFHHSRRKGSQAISISDSISSDVNGVMLSEKRKSSQQCGNEITKDSGTFLTSIEDSEGLTIPEPSCLSSESQPKATRRKRTTSPLPSSRSGYRGVDVPAETLPTVAEVQLPGAAALKEGEIITERT